jgi:hypothetical protein
MLITHTLENVQSHAQAGIIITDNLVPESIDDWSTRQAFYKIRAAIATSQSIDKNAVKPDSRLADFFTPANRRQSVAAFQFELGIKTELFVTRTSFEWAVLASAVISLIALFFSWKAAISGLACTAAFAWIAGRFGQELECSTVKQLAEKMVREH